MAKFELEGAMSKFSIDRANMTDEQKEQEAERERTVLDLKEPPSKKAIPVEIVEMIIRILLRASRP